MRETIAKPKPSSTLLLLRDKAPRGCEVLMIRRPEKSRFAGGKLVFPGGQVADADADLACRAPSGTDELAVFKVSAIRETFEEAGVLLAYDKSSGALVGAERWRALVPFRRRLSPGVAFADFLADQGLCLALDRLVPFARWITPEDRPIRFDTWFFLAEAPNAQEASPDGSEAIESSWLDPACAGDDAHAVALGLMLPTWANLRRLARSNSVAEAMAAARSRPVVPVMPVLDTRSPGGPVVRIPEAAGYGFTSYPYPWGAERHSGKP
jgi:8-oxo-dGTP pyrophosphatase MutT (NUDIX family)